MRQLRIKQNNSAFAAEWHRSGDGKVPVLKAGDLLKLPADAYVLIGERSAKMGGGLASTGYVMVSEKAVGTVSGVNQTDVQRGLLAVK